MADHENGMMDKPLYPETRTTNQVDHYHGVAIADPYRWLEDDTSPERATWIALQNAVTAKYLSRIALRRELRRRFESLLKYPRYYDLVRRDPWLFFKKNDGLQNQLIVYGQRGFSGTPEVLIDPTQLAADGTIRITSIEPSRDARYLAYGLSYWGSDWQEYFVKDMLTRQVLPEVLRWVKFSTIAWRGDGFYYSRFAPPSDAARALSERNVTHQVWHHKVGTPQSVDQLIYEDREHGLRLHSVQTTKDERFAALTVTDCGSGDSGNALWLLDAQAQERGFSPIVSSFHNHVRLVDNQDSHLIILTNHSAPKWRLVLIDAANPDEKSWKELIPEGEHRLEWATSVGGKLFVAYRVDAAHALCVFDRGGRFEQEIPLPDIGLVQVFQGQPTDRDILWSFTSYTRPATIFRYDIATRTSAVFKRPKLPFNLDDYETDRVRCSSKDGTQVLMFTVHRKGLVLDGSHPLLLCGYGGNDASVGPSFDPFLIALLERGVIFAAACLRGGGEYGDSWHNAGRRQNKQNVFDDCIAAGEWLQTSGYTNKDKCALTGSSNGGLLVGAVMMQRPDLFKVALPDVGVMDMLRFQQFTAGAAWVAEYGSSDDPSMFPKLLAYSPLHVRSLRDDTPFL